MKYTIEGFSQEKLVEYGLDAKDAILLRWIVDFYNTGKMKIYELEGKRYFWVHYKTLIKEIPILNIKKRALATRMQKMCDCKLLEFYLEKTTQGTYTYYRFIENALEQLLTKADSRSNDNRGAVQTTVRTAVQTTPKDSSLRIHQQNNIPSKNTDGVADINTKDIKALSDAYYKLFTDRFNEKPNYPGAAATQMWKKFLKKDGLAKTIEYMEEWFRDGIGEWHGYNILKYQTDYNKILISIAREQKEEENIMADIDGI